MKTRKIDYSETRRSAGCSMADLPEDILYDIMLRLSVRSIVMSKSVCKTWHGLISDPRFAKLHLAQAKPCPLVRDRQNSRFSRALYMVESVEEGDFVAGYCSCCSSERECNRCQCTIMKVKSKLKIPIRNKDILLRQAKGDIANVVFSTNVRCTRKNCEMVFRESLRNYVFSDVTSCNGLLCLSSCFENHIVVCNPITGEYIFLPDPQYKNTPLCDLCIGFSPKSNQYKVLRLRRGTHTNRAALDIHTLGTKAWTSVDLSEFEPKYTNTCVCLNGAFHWVCTRKDMSLPRRIACFDMDDECFQSPFSIPNSISEAFTYMAIRLLGDRLCLYNHKIAFESCIDVWVMEEYGVAESWTRLVSINVSGRGRIHEITTISRFQTLSNWGAGASILLYQYNTLIYCDRQGVFRFKHIRSRGISSKFEFIAHIPSFASLKDMVDTTDTEVCNVYSGCGKIQLMEENYPVYLACMKKD